MTDFERTGGGIFVPSDLIDAPPPPAGHNNPPLTDEEAFRLRLAEDQAKHTKRRDELLAEEKLLPAAVTNDDEAGKLGDFIKSVTAAHKAAEATRVAAKEPFLTSSRVVDGFFKKILTPLERAKATVQDKLGPYLKKKADEERRALEEAARIAREQAEAEMLAAESATAQRAVDQHLDAAAQHESQATDMEIAAGAKAADLSRVRGDYGSVQSLTSRWTFDIIDFDKIPLEAIRAFISRDAIEIAIGAFVRSGNRTLAGVRIFEKYSARVV